MKIIQFFNYIQPLVPHANVIDRVIEADNADKVDSHTGIVFCEANWF